MNHLNNLDTLNNRYFVMRHGESLANQQGLIVSSPDNGLDNYGLSEHGREQARHSAETHSSKNSLPTHIFSSDFKRAKETALIAHQHFRNTALPIYNPQLRERFFGDFELGKSDYYQSVWDKDVIDADHNWRNVESAEQVLERVTSLVLQLEGDFSQQIILLVSHGDTLQILQTGFKKIPAAQHRSLPHLETAEIRELV